MANPIKGNPEGCWMNDKGTPAECVECYWSKVRNGQWKGSQKCWNSQCLVLDRAQEENESL